MLPIIERIKTGENRTLELKREVPRSLKSIMKTIVSFANEAGGDILIGVENDGQLSGVQEDTLLLEERISNAVHDTISPIPSVFYKVLNIGDKQIFNIKVLPGIQKPYYIRKEGIENGVYIRIGSTIKKADGAVIDELRRQNLNLSYDEKISYQHSYEHLSDNCLKIFTDRYGETELNPGDVLLRDKYVQKTNSCIYPTIGAVLLFSDKLPSDLEYAAISISKYEGKERANLKETIQINRGLVKIVSLAISELKSLLWEKIEIKNFRREEQWEIPELSIREALINAVCHRDYSIVGASTKIDIFDDRLEIISPGNLPIGITLEELGQGASEIRNKIIAKAFRRMGYIEKLGTGISRMVKMCRIAGIPLPVFEEPGRYFKVTFFRGEEKYRDFEERIMEKIGEYKEVTAKELAGYLDVHSNTVLNHVRRMIKHGSVEKIGKGPNVRYRLKL